MPTVVVLVAIVLVGSIGVVVVISCYSHPRGHLRHVVAAIGRPPASRRLSATRRSQMRRAGSAALVRRIDPAVLGLLEIDPERLVAQLLALGATAGTVIGAMAVVATIDGLLPPWSPAAVAVGVGVIVPVIRCVVLVTRARTVHIELRHQLAGYLDLVTIVIAGDIGYEAALRIAADSGDGRLFSAVRHRIREATAAGRSAIDALYAVGDDLGLDELGQVAATIELAATEGSPVVRTLSATCATLRSTLAAQHEAEARLRTSRLTAPLIGMALIFMGLVVYPALHP